MNFEDKMQLAVEMANARFEYSANSAGEILGLHGKSKSDIDSSDPYIKAVKAMLDFINQEEVTDSQSES